MNKIFFGFIPIIVFTNFSYGQSLRSAFLEGKTEEQIYTSFENLNSDDKIAIWIDKLDQILMQNLPTQQSNSLEELKNAMLQKSLSKVIESSENLARITSELDFQKMFYTLNDYDGSNQKGSVSEYTLSTLKNIGPNVNPVSKECTCNWMCSTLGGHHGGCRVTMSGCGFLWAFSCDGTIFDRSSVIIVQTRP
ncbi:MAG: bacteriocin fulvocin C-related protein [Flavobacterium sp.]|nr:bacteriocin fulvocin C-related protein [Flavobacterium sp.]